MNDQNVCELLNNLFAISESMGMVGVPSGLVTLYDMDRADKAITDYCSFGSVHMLKRKCYVLSNGDQVQDPKGMQSSRLNSIWLVASVNTEILLELLENCDKLS